MSIIKVIQRPPAEVLAEKRVSSSLTLREFCLNLVREGVLTPLEAVEASRGNWPAPMDSFLAYLTPEQSAEVQIEWAASGTIERMHSFVLTLASWLTLTDAEVDTLFNISIP